MMMIIVMRVHTENCAMRNYNFSRPSFFLFLFFTNSIFVPINILSFDNFPINTISSNFPSYIEVGLGINVWGMSKDKTFLHYIQALDFKRILRSLKSMVADHHILMRFLARELHSACKGLFAFH